MNISTAGIEINRISWPRAVWLLIAGVMFWHLLFVRLNERGRDIVIGSDAAGYYAYLPAIFIYSDLEYKFCQDGSPSKVNSFGANQTFFMNRTLEGKLINKYFIGTAVLEAPFFLVAYGTANWFGFPADGYSFPFQIAVALAGLFYGLLGLDQLRKLLAKLNVSDTVTAVTMLTLFFGTNLYHYSLAEPGMSHIFSFCMVAIFLNQTHNLFHSQNKKSIAGSIISLTMIVLIRPVNGSVMLTIPLIAGSWPVLKNGTLFVWRNIKRTCIAVSIAAAMFFLQFLVYKLSVGHWIADSYSGETFDLTNVHFANVLFSWRKGFFIYTPLMALAMPGIVFLRNNFSRICFLVFWVVNVWFIASWQTWEYGGSYGMRPMVDSYAVMSIPLAFLIQKGLRGLFRLITIPVLTFLVIVNLIQLYQYQIGIMPYDGLTCNRYKKIFLVTDPLYRAIYDPGTLKMHTLPEGSQKIASFTRTFEEDTSVRFNDYWCITSEKAFSGKYSVKLDTGMVTSGLAVMFRDAVPDSLFRYTWAVIRSKIYLTGPDPRPKMAVSCMDNGEGYFWDGPPLWHKVEYYGRWADFYYPIKLPLPKSPNGEIRIFLIHDDQSVAYADDMTIEFWVEPH